MNKLKANNERLEDPILWSQLKAGDEEAFSLLFERYYSQLVNYGKTLMLDAGIVKDCVQDVFMDVWKYRNKLNETVVVKAYLLSSVRKRIIRLNERERIFFKTKDIDTIEFLFDFSIEDKLITDQTKTAQIEQLNRLINNLPSRQKEALYLRYHHGLSVQQVSEVLNMGYQSAKNLLYRAVIQLRKDFPTPFLILIIRLWGNN